MKKMKESSKSIYIQLELNFNSVDKTMIISKNVKENISFQCSSFRGEIINLTDKIKEIEKLREKEIIDYILTNSKRF
ncbi:hypothetical protein SAMN05421786_102414 [Chryseobacterium ureilyticum]|uniref:Uncharacterized protein n=1 Tax=Chryseobacterium ureilyticum TaxID=373668 RepID=A0A1N7MAB1_9FLAO|nr:hypothetical protein [Chryseobacterium ureilyticum]SIS83046.1 hypothetical protein SAMN05421786_102414 [Chryseobacterium ureilyticum]